MLKLLLSSLGALAAPLLSLAVRANRRHRLRSRVADQLALAAELREQYPGEAAEVDGLVRESVAAWMKAERTALRRSLDASTVVTLVFLVGLAIVPLYFAWTSTAWWRWPAVAFLVLWMLVWGGVGGTQIWKVKEEDAATP